MEWGQQFTNHEELVNNATYQNSGYIDIRNKNKTLILDVDIGNGTTFTKSLHEPFKIDKLSDIYLESFTTFNSTINTGNDTSGYLLSIDQFNIKSNSNTATIFNKLYITNEDSTGGSTSTMIHKSKKMNYICTINPTTIDKLSGSITFLDGTTAPFGATTGRFIAELVIVNRD